MRGVLVYAVLPFLLCGGLSAAQSPPAVVNYTPGMAQIDRGRALTAGDAVSVSPEDVWIHGQIVDKIAVDPNAPRLSEIHVDVVNGWVTLRGDADTNRALLAADRIVRETAGVQRVSNRLVVHKP